MVVTRSIRIQPGTWRLPAPASLDSALITIRGENITVDFAGATLEGMDPAAEPDLAVGVGIRVEGGRNVRIYVETARQKYYAELLFTTGAGGAELAHFVYVLDIQTGLCEQCYVLKTDTPGAAGGK